MNFSVSDRSIDFLTSEFGSNIFHIFSAGGSDKIFCFSCQVKNSDTLRTVWGNVTSLIAGKFQSELENNFSIWNMYLLFICKDEIPKTLRYEIENDRFSMRKLVVDKFGDDNPTSICNFLDKEILGYDLKLNDSKVSESSGEPTMHSQLQIEIDNLGEIPLGSKDDSAVIRNTQISILLDWVSKNEN